MAQMSMITSAKTSDRYYLEVNTGTSTEQSCDTTQPTIGVFLPTGFTWGNTTTMYSNDIGTEQPIANWYQYGGTYRYWNGGGFETGGTCIYAHNLGTDPSSSTAACAAATSVYYMKTQSFSDPLAFGIYTDSNLQTPAAQGYYSSDDAENAARYWYDNSGGAGDEWILDPARPCGA